MMWRTEFFPIYMHCCECGEWVRVYTIPVLNVNNHLVLRTVDLSGYCSMECNLKGAFRNAKKKEHLKQFTANWG